MISHHHKCVFIHIPKTAGQSIEQVFLDLLGLTWEERNPLLLKPNDNPELGPPRLAHLRAYEYVSYKHMTAFEFNSYFKFTFVRNPWDRAVSIYKHLANSDEYDFKQFLFKKLSRTLWNKMHWFVRPQSDFIYAPNGELLIDFIGRFENIQGDFEYVCEQIGLQLIKVPHMNKSIRKKNEYSYNPKQLAKHFLQRVSLADRNKYKFESYVEFYDNESKELVAELYERDIVTFRYNFGSNVPAN
jgi:hypothetical protein